MYVFLFTVVNTYHHFVWGSAMRHICFLLGTKGYCSTKLKCFIRKVMGRILNLNVLSGFLNEKQLLYEMADKIIG